MILTRTPLRIGLAGGGTDIPSYYTEYGGFCITASINKYIYVMKHDTTEEGYILKYAKAENVKDVGEIQHPIIRESFRLHGVRNTELASISDVPGGTGLGSSSAFTVGLLHAIRGVADTNLAEEACKIEIDILKEPIGKQDQYAAYYGGVTAMEFTRKGRVRRVGLKVPGLIDNLALFRIGWSRNASDILRLQTRTNPLMHEIKAAALRSHAALVSGDYDEYGRLLGANWQAKRALSPRVTSERIDALYEFGKRNGALGGKLCGAGGCGFMLFYTTDKPRLVKAMSEQGVQELPFEFDYVGSIIAYEDKLPLSRR